VTRQVNSTPDVQHLVLHRSNYLVTGGAGFIGSNIVERLVEEGQSVRVLDNFSTGKRENVEPWLDRIELIEGDLRDLDTVREAVNGVDYVLHQGAIPSVPRSVNDPMRSHECNATGTLNVLIAARDAGVKRVVYASSSSVYGDSPELPKREDMPTNPLSPYAVSKLSGENYAIAFHQVYGLPTVCLRYFNVFGPRQDPASEYAAVIPKFITRMLRGERPIVYGDGLQSRDFTYVANVVEANLLACQSGLAVGQVMNAALGGRVSLLELIAQLNGILGANLAPRFEPARPGDVKHSQADTTRLKSLLHFEPVVGFDEGLRKALGWFRSTSEE
jgi:UDP-glucose 4-epimerase